jgi:hypothetical protein
MPYLQEYTASSKGPLPWAYILMKIINSSIILLSSFLFTFKEFESKFYKDEALLTEVSVYYLRGFFFIPGDEGSDIPPLPWFVILRVDTMS